MSDARKCTDCGEPLAVNARSCSCGWRFVEKNAPRGMAAASMDTNRMRCAWESNGQRCRYSGSCSNAHNPSSWYCAGHARCVETADGALGQRIVDESVERIPEGIDYSAMAIAKRTRDAYIARELPPVPDRPAGVRYVAPTPDPTKRKPDLFRNAGTVAAAHMNAPAAAAPSNPTAARYEDDEDRREREAIEGGGW